MISFEEALATVRDSVCPCGTERISLSEALGRVVAEEVVSDIDSPPFNKSAMDGYACRREDCAELLEVIEEIPAGYRPTKKIGRNQCAKIMTGGMVPEGADCVVMVERTEEVGERKIRVTTPESKSNICPRGEDIREGDCVVKKGTRLLPQHLGLLAAVGCAEPLVYRRPQVGIIATGDELVEPAEKPGLSQIRNSNSYQLYAHVEATGALPRYYGIARDRREAIEGLLTQALEENDIVLLSGGVSVGEYDLVPEMLRRNGVKLLFEKVASKPGKPTVFGLSHRAACFGLPGNPVSTFVVFEFLVKPFINGMLGLQDEEPEDRFPLEETVRRKKAKRRECIPVRITEKGTVRRVEFHGSAHIRALSDASGLMWFPAGVTELAAGTVVPVRRIDRFTGR